MKFSILPVDLKELSSSVRFYPVQESELGRINELCNTPEIADNFETIPPISMETTRAMWNYMQSGIVSLWGIHMNTRIVGGAGFYVQPPGTKISHVATFFLYLEPAYWGMGIGKEAILFLEREAKDRGYTKMECLVTIVNSRAIRLYERLGYLQEGIKKKAFFDNGEYSDLVLMGKFF